MSIGPPPGHRGTGRAQQALRPKQDTKLPGQLTVGATHDSRQERADGSQVHMGGPYTNQ